jgi:Ca2+:H+ antiporter
MISAVMLTGEGKPEIARDTMFSVVMILLGGMTGVSLLLGGLRHHEQNYNLQSANAFLALIIPLAVLGLVLPSFTTTTAGLTLSPFQSVFTSLMSIGIYGVFLAVQTKRHRDFFVAPKSDENTEDDVHLYEDHKVESTAITPFFSCCIFCRSSFSPNNLPCRLITELAL